jgi:hypothetical protein
VDQAGNAPLWDVSLLGKTYVLLSPITTYVLSLDLLLAAAILAPLLWALAIGRLHAHAGLLVAAGGLVLLALAAPTAVAGTWWIDNRFPIMALLALVAGTWPDLALSGAGRLLIAVALAGVVHVRSGSIAYVWHQRQADIEAVRKAVQHVPAGAAILPLDNVLTDGEARAIPIGRYFHNGNPSPRATARDRRGLRPSLYRPFTVTIRARCIASGADSADHAGGIETLEDGSHDRLPHSRRRLRRLRAGGAPVGGPAQQGRAGRGGA